jgi:hypothetical protein
MHSCVYHVSDFYLSSTRVFDSEVDIRAVSRGIP